MIPTPTPPPLPIGAPLVDFGSTNWGAELSTNAIQGWNMANQTGVLSQFQVFVVVMILLLGAGAIIAMLNRV